MNINALQCANVMSQSPDRGEPGGASASLS